MVKYYKEIFRTRNWNIFFRVMFFTLLGCFTIFLGMIEFMKYGMYIEYSSHMPIQGVFVVGPWLYLLVGIVCVYTGLIWIPMWWLVEAQELSEYEVSSDENYIYVKYRDYVWTVERRRFRGTSFFWFDDNRKFITYTKGMQVFQTVKRCFAESIRFPIGKELMGENQIQLFEESILVDEEMKKAYFKRFHLERNHIGIKFLAALICGCALIFVIALFGTLSQKALGQSVGNIVSSIILFLISKSLYAYSNIESDERKWIQNHSLYCVKAYCYEKLGKADSSGKYRFVRICNNRGIYIDKAFSLYPKEYQEIVDDVVYVYYYLDQEGKCKMRLTAKMLGL